METGEVTGPLIASGEGCYSPRKPGGPRTWEERKTWLKELIVAASVYVDTTRKRHREGKDFCSQRNYWGRDLKGEVIPRKGSRVRKDHQVSPVLSRGGYSKSCADLPSRGFLQLRA